jgi:hypothetical protein
MTATVVPPPPFTTPFLDGPTISNAWQVWISAIQSAVYGPGFDKVDAGFTAAMAAAPAARQIVGVGGLQVGGALTGNVAVALYAAKTTVAGLPTTGVAEGDWAYALNGRKPGQAAGAGTGVPCFWSAGAWIAVTSGVAVTA